MRLLGSDQKDNSVFIFFIHNRSSAVIIVDGII
jgi:hypothetical protein